MIQFTEYRDSKEVYEFINCSMIKAITIHHDMKCLVSSPCFHCSSKLYYLKNGATFPAGTFHGLCPYKIPSYKMFWCTRWHLRRWTTLTKGQSIIYSCHVHCRVNWYVGLYLIVISNGQVFWLRPDLSHPQLLLQHLSKYVVGGHIKRTMLVMHEQVLTMVVYSEVWEEDPRKSLSRIA